MGQGFDARKGAKVLYSTMGQLRSWLLERRSAADEAEGFVGGAELRRVLVENHRDGNILEQTFKVPFVLEGQKEFSVFHFVENFDGDAAGDVNTAKRENLERKISRFSAINVGPEVERFDADRTSFVERVLGDFR